MPHIHTQPGQHDHTASGFIIQLIGNKPKLLLHRHKKLGLYLQFGGHVELNESPWQAVAHEIQEESGYNLDQLMVLQPKKALKKLTGVVLHPYPIGHMTHAFNKNHYHSDIEYALTTKELPAKKVARGESKNIRAFSRNELISLSSKEVPENVRELGMFIFDVCLIEWESLDTKHFGL